MKSTLKTLALAVMMGITGCYVVVAEPSGVVVTSSPPTTVVEVRTPAPASNYVWIEGYWSWYGGRWVWVSGHWEPVRVGYVWVVPHYEYRNGQHYYVQGGWVQSGKGSGYKGKGSNQGYPTSHKCPKGYAWIDGACRYNQYKTNYK